MIKKTLILIFTLAHLNVSCAADRPLQRQEYRVTKTVPNAKAAMILFNDEKIKAFKMLKSEDLIYTQIVKETSSGFEVTYIWKRK